MAHRKIARPQTVRARDLSELIFDIHTQLMPEAAEPTYIVIPSLSGTIDPITEVISYHTSDTQFAASGIVGTVTEEDRLYGLGGQIQVGDVKVTYEYTSISGVLPFAVDQINLLTPGVSGAYFVQGRIFDQVGDTPILVDYALRPKNNG